MERYQRQIILPGIGLAGQQKLQAANVLVVGAGGLGCPALQYLAAAGIGTIGIVDHDTVQLSNLHRQILFGTKDVNQLKAIVAAEVLSEINNEITITPHAIKLTNQNAWNLIEQYDIILDGTDNFETRYLINDVCALQNKPLVYASIYKFEGQVAVFNIAVNGGKPIHYRHLFPEPPKEVPNCAEAGVLGVLAGIMGTLQAAETIKLITGIGKPLANEMLVYNLLDHQSMKWRIPFTAKAAEHMPQTREALEAYDYVLAACAKTTTIPTISAINFNGFLQDTDTTIIDVREPGELPLINGFPHLKIPLGNLPDALPVLDSKQIIVFCAAGKRSAQAADIIRPILPANTTIFSLEGGINNWLKTAN